MHTYQIFQVRFRYYGLVGHEVYLDVHLHVQVHGVHGGRVVLRAWRVSQLEVKKVRRTGGHNTNSVKKGMTRPGCPRQGLEGLIFVR